MLAEPGAVFCSVQVIWNCGVSSECRRWCSIAATSCAVRLAFPAAATTRP
jgi:hypothetical protein